MYTRRASSEAAASAFAALKAPLAMTALLLYEFENAMHHSAWLNLRDKRLGLSTQTAQTALARLESDIESGNFNMVTCDFLAVLETARRISNVHTWRSGFRAFDILHVATACHLKAALFLTFDAAQRRLAQLEGLKVGPDPARG
jgi:hypothetical protein